MIKPPGWCSHAVPTLRGWKHPRTSEMLKKRSISQAEIDEWYAAHGETVEEVVEETTYDDMSKAELELLGRQHGIELDRRQRKATLVETLKSAIKLS